MVAFTDAEAAARCRAAMAFAGLTYEQLEEKSGVSYDTLRALMGKTKPRGATLDRAYAIADACEVPRRFIDEGWAPLQDDRLAQLEQAVNELRGAQGLPPLPGALGSFQQEPGSDREHPGRSQTQAEGGTS